MPIGWTVEVTTHDPNTWRPTSRRQIFDVAIEDKDNAIAAVRLHTRADACVAVVAIEELHNSRRLSPGRIRPRRTTSTATAFGS